MMHNDWIESAWAAHSCDLRHYARGYCGNVEQAEDAVQDAFLKLQQTTPAVAGDPPRPWLFRVVRNRLIDLHRRIFQPALPPSPTTSTKSVSCCPPLSLLAPTQWSFNFSFRFIP